jgi:Rad3-related DNA helicase
MTQPTTPKPSQRIRRQIQALEELLDRLNTAADEAGSLRELLALVETISRTTLNLITLQKNAREMENVQEKADLFRQAMEELKTDLERQKKEQDHA